MQYQTNSNEMVMCIKHSYKPVKYIFCKENCPYPSRLICSTCFSEYKTNDGFFKLKEVLRDPRVIMNSQESSEKGIYNQLNAFFDLLDQDPDEVINNFKMGTERLIEQLLNTLKIQIEQYRQFRVKIEQVKLQFFKVLGQENFNQAFKDILKFKGYHYGSEWKQLEETVKKYILKFKDQNNQELTKAYSKIKQLQIQLIKYRNFLFSLSPQLLIDFKTNILSSVQLFNTQLENLMLYKQYSTICDQLYFFELIQRIKKNINVKPQVTLIFKASEHGMNGQSFWARCSYQGPTITICKSKNGYVFGGYTPCKWVPNGNWQKDESKTSFLFSYTRKEIYPILSVDHAIYCQSNYGPTFGGGHNLYIAADFQSGHSSMTGQYYSNESYKIENQQTHLMGDMTSQLVEMEVFAIK